MPNTFLVLLLSIAAFVVFIAVLARRKNRSYIRPPVGSYEDMRPVMIQHVKKNERWSGAATRPTNLDNRIDRSMEHILVEAYRQYSNKEGGVDQLHEVYSEITMSIFDELQKISKKYDAFDLISEPRRVVYVVDSLQGDINNGGFDQYYINSAGNGASIAPACLRRVDLESIANLVERGNAEFKELPASRRYLRMEQLEKLGEDTIEKWDCLSEEFYQSDSDITGQLVRYILMNRDHFFRDSL